MLRVVGDNASYEQHCSNYENSPYMILLSSEALEQVKSVQLLPLNGTFEFNALVRISNDYRWHWITDHISDIDFINESISQMIDRHLSLFPEDEEVFIDWKRELKNTDRIETNGISLMYEELH
ncbi:hypothetical protein J8A87_20235 [Vibrio parahaemolyticus]|uniref:hypothetical protein n=1 Tax=Vibrio TaxID=662 RepID=UPI00296412DA|nr:hypothetical protein [Vibrio sp. Vb0587]MBE4779459.1 hypothetical protein [Vibrio parahaemolyticus]MCF9166790.1 hypothetical protein [Vibrio parahaemolyticus]MDG3409919.1 hypothetical protein [Vibrio parahaemolyticus]MDW1963932.1 hypothetical protein [Vibrio sp. Vb0587]